MTPSRQAIDHELSTYPEICMGRENVAINRIRQRRAILSFGRGVRQLERDHAEHKAAVNEVALRLDRIAERLGVS